MSTKQKSEKTKLTLWQSTKRDFSESFRLLKENYKAFIMTELFAVISFILILIIFGGILMLTYILIPSLSPKDIYVHFSEGWELSHLYRALVMIFALGVFYAFLTCQLGLAYDVMSSGDMFAEFKNSFTYFKRFWWQYPLLTIIIILPNLILTGILYGPRKSMPPGLLSRNFGLSLVQYLFLFVWFMLFIETLPSLTAQRSIKKSLQENFAMLRTNLPRFLSTWGVFFLIFIIPGLFIDIFVEIFGLGLWTLLVGLIFFLTQSLIGFPLIALISTGLYNNTPIHDITNISNNHKNEITKPKN
ncbi:MAG: hypothetical protein ACTSVL_08985 [Promethearchaeota archaeon]